MTRFLLLGDRAIQHALATRLKEEGGTVRVFPGQNFGGYEIDANPNINDYDCVVVSSARYFDHPVVKRAFESRSCSIFGVDSNAAKLETSKSFFSDFADRYGIKTPESRVFSDFEQALAFITSSEPPYVIKADGPARGCGVEIAHTVEDAERDLKRKLVDTESPLYAGTVKIERFIEGFEVAINVFLDGEHYVILPPTKPHKRRKNDDAGPNVAGMGSLSPIRLNEDFYRELKEKIIEPTMKAVQSNGWYFRGCLFMNLMLNESGIYVLEYNCRMGDPAMLVDIELLDSSLSTLILNTAQGKLSDGDVTFKDGFAAATTIVRAAYPDVVSAAGPVALPPPTAKGTLFVAGLYMNENALFSNSGVVGSAVAYNSSPEHALLDSLELAGQFMELNPTINLDCRTDIGKFIEPPQRFAS